MENEIKQKTAVDYLEMRLETILGPQSLTPKQLLELSAAVSSAKTMEMKQIVDAHVVGLVSPLETEAYQQGMEYYNKYYGTE
jgi:hypothetical protein